MMISKPWPDLKLSPSLLSLLTSYLLLQSTMNLTFPWFLPADNETGWRKILTYSFVRRDLPNCAENRQKNASHHLSIIKFPEKLSLF